MAELLVNKPSNTSRTLLLAMGNRFANAAARYTSQVTIEEPLKVISRVSDSTLFDHLDTTWEFAGGPTPDSCWLTFSIDFAFKSPLYGQLASLFFQEVSDVYPDSCWTPDVCQLSHRPLSSCCSEPLYSKGRLQLGPPQSQLKLGLPVRCVVGGQTPCYCRVAQGHHGDYAQATAQVQYAAVHRVLGLELTIMV